MRRIYTFGQKYVNYGKHETPRVRTFSALHLFNPYKMGKDGRDPEIAEAVMRHPGAEPLIQQIIDCGEEEVAVYCHGGRHRSVAIAEEVGKRTGAEVVHLSMPFWPTYKHDQDILEGFLF